MGPAEFSSVLKQAENYGKGTDNVVFTSHIIVMESVIDFGLFWSELVSVGLVRSGLVWSGLVWFGLSWSGLVIEALNEVEFQLGQMDLLSCFFAAKNT